MHNFSSRTERNNYGKGLHKIAEYAANPHRTVLEFITPYLEDIELYPTNIMVATYRRPERTEGGVYLTEKSLDEDMYQGAAGLVLKVGSAAFLETDTVTFAGFKVEPLDWVTFRPVHGSAREIAGIHCRFIDPRHIDAKIKDPTLVW